MEIRGKFGAVLLAPGYAQTRILLTNDLPFIAHRAILHDESTYPDPFVFRPERFLGETSQPDPQDVCFGFGRR